MTSLTPKPVIYVCMRVNNFATRSKIYNTVNILYIDGKQQQTLPSLVEIRTKTKAALLGFRSDHLRHLNPTPFKVSVTDNLYKSIHSLWLKYAPVPELD